MTAIFATPRSLYGRVDLAVTGAPGPPANIYTSNFTAGVDGWTATGAGTMVRDGAKTPNALKLSAAGATSWEQGSKTLPGLTIGAAYRVRAWFTRTSGFIQLEVSGIAAMNMATPVGVRAVTEIVFTATATSHTFNVRASGDGVSSAPLAWFDTVTLFPMATWQGTSITRTDANGVNVPVRQDAAVADVAVGGSTLTLADWEAAVCGSIGYTVHDGNGGTATTSTTFDGLGAGKVWLTVPATATPSDIDSGSPDEIDVELVTGYAETTEATGTLHAIIGRADRVATPGPLGLRRGTMDLFCSTYTSVWELRNLAAAGEVLLLRQPTHLSMDLYFYPTSVDARPEPPTAAARRWIVSITYEQVMAV